MGTAENQTENDANFTLFAAVGAGAVVLLIFIVLACILPTYMKSQKSEKRKDEVFHTDENHVYGTYSRGSVESGEYGDGDVIEIIDTNVYYG